MLLSLLEPRCLRRHGLEAQDSPRPLPPPHRPLHMIEPLGAQRTVRAVACPREAMTGQHGLERIKACVGEPDFPILQAEKQ